MCVFASHIHSTGASAQRVKKNKNTHGSVSVKSFVQRASFQRLMTWFSTKIKAQLNCKLVPKSVIGLYCSLQSKNDCFFMSQRKQSLWLPGCLDFACWMYHHWRKANGLKLALHTVKFSMSAPPPRLSSWMTVTGQRKEKMHVWKLILGVLLFPPCRAYSTHQDLPNDSGVCLFFGEVLHFHDVMQEQWF